MKLGDEVSVMCFLQRQDDHSTDQTLSGAVTLTHNGVMFF